MEKAEKKKDRAAREERVRVKEELKGGGGNIKGQQKPLFYAGFNCFGEPAASFICVLLACAFALRSPSPHLLPLKNHFCPPPPSSHKLIGQLQVIIIIIDNNNNNMNNNDGNSNNNKGLLIIKFVIGLGLVGDKTAFERRLRS